MSANDSNDNEGINIDEPPNGIVGPENPGPVEETNGELNSESNEQNETRDDNIETSDDPQAEGQNIEEEFTKIQSASSFQTFELVEDSTALNASVVQFLALYLLVLAFFIWLVSLARFEGVKSLAVINSLKSTFETVEQKKETTDIRTLIRSKITSAKQFEDNIKGLFSTLLGVEKVEAPTPGQTMRVVMSANTLFKKNSTEIKSLNHHFMDRVIASLSERPPGYHFDMEFIIGSNADSSGYGTLPTNQTLEMARAGAFVRSMLERGAPPDTLSVGIRKGSPGSVVLWFYIRSPMEVDTYYEKLRSPSSKVSDGEESKDQPREG